MSTSQSGLTPIKFGTDGWRAIIADDYTFANVRRCAQGMALLVKGGVGAERGVVVGYDLRFESEDFAAATADVLAANDIPTFLCRRAEPTPVISHSILNRHLAAGVTITASHNPAIWNGFKVRSDYGGAADPQTIARLENLIAGIGPDQVNQIDRAHASGQGLIQLLEPSGPYIEQIGQLVDLSALRSAGLKVAVDPMYGSGIGWFPDLIGGGSTKIVQINGERNPSFGGINPEPITRNLHKLSHTVHDTRAIVGIATDGDADRLGVVDEHGHFINQLRVYSLLALYLLELRGWRGPIVKTLSTSSMLDRLGEIYGVPVHETGVGFKYVAPKMIETNALIGGEESGGYAFRGHIPERDGILAGLFILDMIVKLGKTPSELVDFLFEKVGPHFYDRLDVDFPSRERQAILARLRSAHPSHVAGLKVESEKTEDGFKFMLSHGSWLLIRFSGTEPIMRIYTETTDERRVPEILQAGRALAGV